MGSTLLEDCEKFAVVSGADCCMIGESFAGDRYGGGSVAVRRGIRSNLRESEAVLFVGRI